MSEFERGRRRDHNPLQGAVRVLVLLSIMLLTALLGAVASVVGLAVWVGSFLFNGLRRWARADGPPPPPQPIPDATPAVSFWEMQDEDFEEV